ncbi:C-type mannose receptor 2-like isoform X1 [Argopecten irradians]|uniref:C-type mannose receptor 2-like isoform X1 n=1 Tax=Argopecten irradians TaxID=31199 RepID=UPI00370F927C
MNSTSTVHLIALILGFVIGRSSANLAAELGDCPPSLPRNQNVRSYNNVCLYLITGKMSWNGANSNCHQHGGRLVQIQDQDKQDFIYHTLKAMHWGDWGVWIGATDHHSEGTWKWTDGTKLSYGYWHPGEGPTHGFLFSKAGYEDCALMRLNDGGRWFDYDCGTILYHHTSICEYQKLVRPTTQSPAENRSTRTISPIVTETTRTTILTTTTKTCSRLHPTAAAVRIYRNICLSFIRGNKSWNDAQSECTTQGGMLLQIHDQQEQDFVFGSLKSLHWSDSGAWIGATDRNNEGHWKWNNGASLNYSNWSPDEGPHHIALNENCAYINVDNGLWYDFNCGEVIYNQAYICQD